MIFSIENDRLFVSVDTFGAQLASIRSKKTNVEYLWQGDKTYWGGRAYNLFPTIGRMTDGVYTYQGKTYPLRPHGLARYYEFSVTEHTSSAMTFVLRYDSAEDILEQYPFQFEFSVRFCLEDNRLSVTYKAINLDTECEMICAFGGHPGINVPFDGGCFEDYCLQFEKETPVVQHLLSPNKFMGGSTVSYPLKNGKELPLEHSLFYNDALVFTSTCGEVSIKKQTEPSPYVKMRYDGFKYFAVWQAVDAPFICLEPWQAVCATEGVVDDLEKKADMTHLAPGAQTSATFSLEIED